MTGNNESSTRGNKALRLQVIKNVRALLISAQNGLTVAELQRDYNTMIGKPLPFRELGYKIPLDMLKDLPNVVRPTWENGVLVLKGERCADCNSQIQIGKLTNYPDLSWCIIWTHHNCNLWQSIVEKVVLLCPLL